MGHPNLLFIFTDQQRADTMAAYGNSRIQMPNLNRLASESFVFKQAYVSQPVCTPSRATILTGLYPHTSGCTENNIPLRAEVPCLPEMVPKGHYATAYHGKWHLGDEVFAQHGFDEWISIEDFYTRYYGPGRDKSARSTYHHWLLEKGGRPKDGRVFTRREASGLPEALGKPAYLAQEASRFIRQRRNELFILFVNFLEPHMPYFGPRDGQYDPNEVSLPENFSAVPTADQPLKTRLLQRGFEEAGINGMSLETEQDWRRLISNYWGLCSLVDTHVGTILRALEESGLLEETIVVYTSDHGDMMGSHRLVGKCVMFEEAVRVPLLIRLPGQKGSRTITGPVSQVDLVPTLLDLMGEPIPNHLEGKSLKPLLERGGGDAEGPIFVEWNGANANFGDKIGEVNVPEAVARLAPREDIEIALRDPVRTIVTREGWKFNCSPSGEHELYDLRKDTLETSNLPRRGESLRTMKELARQIRDWQERTNDRVELPASFSAES